MQYIISFFLISNIVFSQDEKIYDESEIWDPEVKIVDPYGFNGAPDDAIILFDGRDFSKWKSESILCLYILILKRIFSVCLSACNVFSPSPYINRPIMDGKFNITLSW